MDKLAAEAKREQLKAEREAKMREREARAQIPKPEMCGQKGTNDMGTPMECVLDKGHEGDCFGREVEPESEPAKRTKGRKVFLHYMFTTALEGGIGYWSECHTYHWIKPSTESEPDLDGFHADISSNDEDGNWGVDKAWQSRHGEFIMDCGAGELTVDIDVMERGMNLFVDKVIAAAKSEDPSAPFSRTYFRQAVVQWLTDTEYGDSDADVADLVVQLGLFGEVVYA